MAKLTKNGVPRGNVIVGNSTLHLDTYRSVEVRVTSVDKRAKVIDQQTVKVIWPNAEVHNIGLSRPRITVT